MVERDEQIIKHIGRFGRRVSTILRQPAKEFSDFLAQSLAC